MSGEQTEASYWLNDTHWMDHSQTLIPDPVPSKRRRIGQPGTGYGQNYVPKINSTGSARTQGYHKISFQEKMQYLSEARGVQEFYELESTELVVSFENI